MTKNADDTIDRLLGRKRAPIWPWIAAGIGLVALAGVIAAWFAWFRRPSWESPAEPWTQTSFESETTLTTPSDTVTESSATTDPLTAGSSGSAPYPIEEA